jgi:hypothetical protein
MTKEALMIRWLGTAVIATGALTVTACSGGSAASTGAAGSTTPTQPRASGGAVPAAFRPAASGEIAQISGHTLQVQSATDQTAVTYSAKTRFTAEQAISLASIHVGSCVVATGPSKGATTTRTITATEVRVTSPQGGSCGGGRFTSGGSLRAGSRPAGFPSFATRSGGAFPSGAPGRTSALAGAFAAGKVSAVSGHTITVTSTRPGSSTVTTSTIEVSAATKYSTTVSATAKALKVGLCAVVNGSTDSTGAVAATRIALSPKTNGSCTTRVFFGGPNG